MTEAGVFDLAEQRLAWLEQRQRTLAQNVANANTPGYQPRDLTPFAARSRASRHAAPVRTQAGHLQGSQGGALQADAHAKPAERAPDGNAVGDRGRAGEGRRYRAGAGTRRPASTRNT